MVMETSKMLFDYLVFIAAIIASFIVPLWGKFRTKRKETKASYVFATGSVSMGAMMLSIARGTLGVRSFLGFPSELYYRGSAMWETIYGMLLAYPIVCFIFVPVYYSLGITSVYQYLDMRFHSKLVRCLASFSYVLRSLLNLAVIVFTPCVALNAVIGLPYWASIIGITTISVIFSSMGGLQAAILSDVIQGVTMITISLLITVEGVVDVGGPSTVLNVTQSRGRLEFLNFNMDPTIRVTTVSATVGQLFMSLSIFGCQQNFVQRYCSMSSRTNVVKTMIYNMPVISAFFTLSWLVGMVIFATYADCDPLRMGYISKFDEIVPFYVEDKLAYIPGVLGLVMATLFNGALTLAVSNLNSLATVTFEDFLSQIPALSHLTDRQQLQLIKLIGVVYGFLIVAASFLVAMLSGVIESSMLMTSATSGPLLGVFILAMLVPCANWKGAASGMLFSHVLSLWLTFGHLTVTNEEDALPLSTDGCKNDTFSSHLMKPTSVLISSVPELKAPITITSKYGPGMLEYIYSITYMYYALIGSLTTVLVGIFVSLLTADEKKDIYEQHLLHPLAVKISKWFPGKPRLFSETRKLSDENENVNPASKTSVNGAEHISIGKTKQGSDQYMKKLHTLKEASLDVTNEVAKGTKL
ncbi:hypothetical protein HCN44_010360 [Aphidius gifuensis]|uniref:Sodium-coupled monocarboxylate transporter n=2 Tax=Aphidius gifuensis TaxID=684658 RepID=A0A834XUN4_APHGI|nr:sodium-coupled monocarboxylate transporter 2 isoform X2 [Aphidius gifuensis]XP_044007380.1 sodium-coupled monocarboxylate transporter 2 isoform X2 [Aphidius gifuensis]XP_044007381.1 sodium-coupled monocarboxylate transporter 2 isoform X2 [Aphidius gifuensis]XP_044007382.1 sodium-coupled monocarboxylate transporter 2 isoform X2 [Aphidius gifuensis]XP_044007383.1 sodium-coupled monocarboxylate transporter 2 isoform X2 [Aphidius gifuensis]XP_044007384.1 sodium-coupled monocarboxylate transport